MNISYIKKILTKEFISCAIISYKIEKCIVNKTSNNKFQYTANCKYCPINNNCDIKNTTCENINIFDRQIISCVQSLLKYFNNNFKKYINNLKFYDIIELFKAYKTNFYQDANCKYIDNNLLHCPLYSICKNFCFKYNCCYENENDNLLIWNVEPIKKE